MKRPIVLSALFLLAAISIASLFQIKYKVQYMKRDLAETYRQLHHEHENHQVLRAEWSYLNHPDRLRLLSQRYLQTDHMKLSQVRSIENSTSNRYFASATIHAIPEFKPIQASFSVRP